MSVDMADYNLRIGILRGFLHSAHFTELRDECSEISKDNLSPQLSLMADAVAVGFLGCERFRE